MMVLVSYDVGNVGATAGARRLRHIAKACKNYGQRVQYSVFECDIDPAAWVQLKNKLIKEIDQEKDSLRFYYLGSNWERRIEHVGAKRPLDLDGPLII